MTWFLLALAAPLCWSLANYLDKFILSRSNENEGSGSGGLFILSCFVSLIFAFCIFLAQGTLALTLPSQETGALIFSGMFQALYLIFYFWALERESTTTVISLFQFAPVMGLLFGYIMLGEAPVPIQLLAIVTILIGTLFIIWKKGEKFSLKGKVFLLMLVSTLFMGFYNTLFRMVGEDINFWVAVFWQAIGISIIGFIFFVVSPVYRKQVSNMVLKRKGSLLAITGLAELLNLGAVLLTNAAVLLAPVALVLAISSVQPLFVFLEAILIAKFLPRFLDESDKPVFRWQYVIGILLVCVGGFLIY